jgi:hypothetical protein
MPLPTSASVMADRRSPRGFDLGSPAIRADGPMPRGISALGERVAVTENGRRRRITKLEANEAKATQSDAERVGDADAIVMSELQRRLRRPT